MLVSDAVFRGHRFHVSVCHTLEFVTKPHDRQSEIVSGKQALVSDGQVFSTSCMIQFVAKSVLTKSISVSEWHKMPLMYSRQTWWF